MSDPLPFRGKMLFEWKRQAQKIVKAVKKNNILFVAVMLTILGLLAHLWNSQPTFYAHAYTGDGMEVLGVQSPLFVNQQVQLFDGKNGSDVQTVGQFSQLKKLQPADRVATSKFAQKLYEIVGEAPIKEMVPFISQRNEMVAAFLVGIAKKESSFGAASPSKDGKTCHNYWGYKGEGGRGTGMGYACFASAEEAVETVGNRIEVLVNKDRNTPARMVDTWKCGRSCAGDPGAPSWVSTVALIFNQIVGKNS